uniref:Uncharacterized protein n=1 Tax=Aegilops tauschii subsp. strangulata TaxID=200361 RepID=A0A453T272_AEGTS
MSLLSYRLSRFVRQTVYATGKASGMIQLLFYFCQPTLLNHIDYFFPRCNARACGKYKHRFLSNLLYHVLLFLRSVIF